MAIKIVLRTTLLLLSLHLHLLKGWYKKYCAEITSYKLQFDENICSFLCRPKLLSKYWNHHNAGAKLPSYKRYKRWLIEWDILSQGC